MFHLADDPYYYQPTPVYNIYVFTCLYEAYEAGTRIYTYTLYIQQQAYMHPIYPFGRKGYTEVRCYITWKINNY